MSKIKYTEDITKQAIQLRLEGKSIPEIIQTTGMKKPSLQKLFQQNNIKLSPEAKEKAIARRWLNHEPVINGKKICSKCGDPRPLEEFHINNQRKSGRISMCKDCYGLYYEENAETIKARSNAYRLSHPEWKKKIDAEYYQSHKQDYVDRAKEWDKQNPEKRKEIKNAYDKRTQPRKNARTAKYRAIKIQATPSWLSQQQLDEIRRIYENCPKEFHVDHIVPLRCRNVRGLHVPWNLQYLPGLDNLRKGNKL